MLMISFSYGVLHPYNIQMEIDNQEPSTSTNTSRKTYYQYCIVPMCTNTSVSTAGKLFIRLPSDNSRRIKWLKACRRDARDIAPNSRVYVCQDHFNLEQDMENYVKYSLVKGKIIMKENVVPHLFDCQVDRKRASTSTPRLVAIKRAKRRVVEEALTPSTSQSIFIAPHIKSSAEVETEFQLPQETSAVCAVDTREPAFPENFKSNVCNVGILAKPYIRSKGVQCNIIARKTVALSPFKLDVKNTASSPIIIRRKEKSGLATASSSASISTSTSTDEDTDTTYRSESSLSSEFIDGEEHIMAKLKFAQKELTLQKVLRSPQLYLGVPKDTTFIIEILEKYCKIPAANIMLTLKKIRTARTFVELGDDFGMSESNASRIFSSSLPTIEKFVRKFIVLPDVKMAKKNLPLAFRARYSKVLYIIDCLEIEIQKPTDAVKQSLTWSEYKKANTLKYLISSTPDGIITFVSTGFGGRTSDTAIVENSRFLEKLVPGTSVMADRGFKHIDNMLRTKNCTLIRPPSVPSGIKSSKEDVLETKRIASLRIHIERVIRRIREFSMLEPHACIDNKLIPYTNLIIKTVCGLVNLQSAIIVGK